MRVEGNTIIFKSTVNNYFKEFMGIKPNTIRKIPSNEEAVFLEFKKNLNKDSMIQIFHVRSDGNISGYYFERHITDISNFEGWIWIISWRHEP